MTQSTSNPAPRRRFLKKAATGAAAAGALAAPMVSRAQTTSLRFQSTWPAKDIFHEYANDFAKKVNDMAGHVDWKRRLVVCARLTIGAARAPAAAAPVAAFFRNRRRGAGLEAL